MTIDEAIFHAIEVAEKYEIASKGKEISEITRKGCAKCAAEHKQLAEWLRQLRKAKRLLGKAMKALNDSSCNKDCRQCKWNGNCEMSCRFAWKYGDEVSALIGDENDDEP